jgi:hypothetical protein
MLIYILAGLVLASLILAIIGAARNFLTYIGIAIILTDIALLINLSLSISK